MRAISLHQPWASAVFRKLPDGIRQKPDETRSWKTHHRGLFLIHATKNPVVQEDGEVLPNACILGTVKLLDCHLAVQVRRSRTPAQLEWGDYGDGRYAWELSDPILFEKPLPYRGGQRWFNVPWIEISRWAHLGHITKEHNELIAKYEMEHGLQENLF